MNEWIGSELMAMLKLEPVIAQEREPVQISIHPCWIESIEESRSHFDSLISLMVHRYDFLAEKIQDLGSFRDYNRRIRRTGSYIYFLTFELNKLQ